MISPQQKSGPAGAGAASMIGNEIAAINRNDLAKWGKVIKNVGITSEWP